MKTLLEDVYEVEQTEIMDLQSLGTALCTAVVPFFAFCFGVSLLELNTGKKGTPMITGLLENLWTFFAYSPP